MSESAEERLKRLQDKIQADESGARSPAPISSEKPGFGTLLLGFALFAGGIFMVTQNTVLYSGFTLGNLLGFTPPFGVVLLPLLIGIGVLCYNEKSPAGWLLSVFGLGIIILGILMGLRISFMPITLFQGILMFGMIFGGAGLMARAINNRR